MSDDRVKLRCMFMDEAEVLRELRYGTQQSLRNAIRAGLPYSQVLGRKLFDRELFRQWVLEHQVDREPRPVGRPKKS